MMLQENSNNTGMKGNVSNACGDWSFDLLTTHFICVPVTYGRQFVPIVNQFY